MMNYPLAAILAGAAMAYLAATLAGQLVARAGFPLPSGNRRIGCVDGLRGYLALSVLIHHFIIWMQITALGGIWEEPSVHLFEELGAGGVALFFMITGLVFYPRVLVGFRVCSWPAIYITRLFRIVPLIGVSLIFITSIIAVRTGQGLDRSFPMAFVKWVTTWSEPPLLGYPDSGRLNAYVLWSLRYEWLFYIFVLPTCALAIDLTRGWAPSWTVPTALLAIGLVARLVHVPIGMFAYLPLFAIGMLAFECQRRENIARLLRTSGAGIVAAAALGIGLTAFQKPYTFALPLFGYFFICVACGNTMGGLLRTKGALVLGECSYGIYLLHGILLSLLFVDAAGLTGSLTAGQLPLLLPLAATAIVLLTSATYLLVERPSIQIGSWFASLWNGRQLRTDTSKFEVAP
jgi:peptidoglycan/LPS O-acetylase OafA/YrhL